MSTAPGFFRPSKRQLENAYGKRVPDVIAPGLAVLFCGINPGLYSAAVSHHFARPGNRFWPTLHQSGFTPRVILPFEEQELLGLGLGITNLIDRATATAEELATEEYHAGARRLRRKVLRFAPKYLAILGLGAFRTEFESRTAAVGLQQEMIGATRIWVLPNPSGLNAHYQIDELARVFGELRKASRK